MLASIVALARTAPVKRFRRRLVVATLIAGALLASCTGLELQQRKWIFQATAATTARSEEERAEFARNYRMEDAWIGYDSRVSGRPIRLHGLWAANEAAGAPVLLYLHGARRSVDDSTYRIDQMRELGFSVLAIDYRGFGSSTDELPSEPAVVEDARAAWAWLGEHRPGADRYLLGYSLGGAVAVQLAAGLSDAADSAAPKGVILESTFTSISELFQTFRWGWLPVTALITERFDSLSAIPRVKVPVLVIHGSDDSLIPSRFGRELYERAGSAKKRFVLIEGGTHYSTYGQGMEPYREALKELFGVGA